MLSRLFGWFDKAARRVMTIYTQFPMWKYEYEFGINREIIHVKSAISLFLKFMVGFGVSFGDGLLITPNIRSKYESRLGGHVIFTKLSNLPRKQFLHTYLCSPFHNSIFQGVLGSKD